MNDEPKTTVTPATPAPARSQNGIGIAAFVIGAVALVGSVAALL